MHFARGQRVELKYRTVSAASKAPNREEIITVRGTVIDSPKWLRADEIAIATGNPEFPVAVLLVDKIVGVQQSVPARSVRSFKVKSGDKIYSVILSNGSYTCTCTGFSFRKTCKHIVAVSQKVKKSG